MGLQAQINWLNSLNLQKPPSGRFLLSKEIYVPILERKPLKNTKFWLDALKYSFSYVAKSSNFATVIILIRG